MTNPNLLVQYIVVRTDLITRLGWTVGAVIAQACHATTAAALQYREDEDAKQYFEDVNNMHKIVLGISSETKLLNLAKRLTDFYIDHRVWTEQPEDIPTCLVTKPAPKSSKAEYFRKLQLFRTPGDKSKMKDKENKSENDDSKSGARGNDHSDRHVHGAGNMPRILENDGDDNDNRSKKRDGSGRKQKKNDRDSHGREQRIGSTDSRTSRKKKNGDDREDHEQQIGSPDSRASRKKKNGDDHEDHEQQIGSPDSRTSRKKKNRDDHTDHSQRSGSNDSRPNRQKNNRDSRDGDDDDERTGSGDSSKGRSGYEGKKDHKNHSREERKESRRDRDRNDNNDLDEARDRMSSSPKLPPIGPRAI